MFNGQQTTAPSAPPITPEGDEQNPTLQGEEGTQETSPTIDSWDSAFAALAAEASESSATDDEPESDGQESDGDSSGESASVEPGGISAGDSNVGTDNNVPVDQGSPGGQQPASATVSPVIPAGIEPSGGTVEQEIKKIQDQVFQQAVQDTNKMFLEARVQGTNTPAIRSSGGRIGATVNDPDIYRVDPDTGLPTFINPDTGQPFTGDNPRKQAQEWVDAYNTQLRDMFNSAAAERQAELQQEVAPAIAVMQFKPKYEKLDPIRKKMFETLVAGHEVTNAAGEQIGYNIDLDQALKKVNDTVKAIQEQKQAQQQANAGSNDSLQGSASNAPKPPGPAMDMPGSGAAPPPKPKEPKNLADALLAQQQAVLDKLNEGKK